MSNSTTIKESRLVVEHEWAEEWVRNTQEVGIANTVFHLPIKKQIDIDRAISLCVFLANKTDETRKTIENLERLSIVYASIQVDADSIITAHLRNKTARAAEVIRSLSVNIEL